jgi:3D (Asp-Asp-Asp) domain-containing protein
MRRPLIAALVLPLALTACTGLVVGGDAPQPEYTLKSVPSDSIAGTFQLTYYTLASEAATSGQHTGNTAVDCNKHGLGGCYHREFLCSGYGVAMQGTGLATDGKYIQYVSGGGGWSSGDTWLNNCDGARFAVTDGVRGASGRLLVVDYSIAVDPAVIPLGWYVWIDSEGHWFRADDTGGAIDGRHIDAYFGASGRTLAASSSRVYVTSTAREKDDPSPYGGGGGGGGDTDAEPPADGDACQGLDFLGECQGDLLRWCEGGTLRQSDCAARGLVCAWQSNDVGYNCVTDSGEPTPAPTPSCGDGLCNGTETCTSCPGDCGSCPPAGPACGDGECNGTETCTSCPGDCGSCPPAGPACGDGECNGTETCTSCPGDCGDCPPTDTCGGLDYLGECQGDTVRWCEGGQVHQYDCATSGQTCAWQDSTVGYNCVDSSSGSGSSCGSGHLGDGENGDACGDPAETWRCAWSDHWGEWASQVCRGGEWVTYHLGPADCAACCGDYTAACS